MTKIAMIILIIIISILILWSIWGYFSSNVEKAKYKILEKTKDYEIREYPPHIIAEVTLQEDYENIMNKGFGIVAKYIFGNNKNKNNIAMTAPVLVKNNTVSFFMPNSYNINTLPKPNDNRIKIISVSTKKYLVIGFRGYRSENKIKKEKEKLRYLATRDNLKTGNDFIYAGYNPPWTPPWMTHNEILVELN